MATTIHGGESELVGRGQRRADSAKEFMNALQAFERGGDSSSLLALFADDCELKHAPLDDLFRGKDGAAEFWRAYRDQFQEVESRFSCVFEDHGKVALEWRSEGKLPGGRPIDYAGVSLLELGDDGMIKALRTYYDSTCFMLVGEHHQKRH